MTVEKRVELMEQFTETYRQTKGQNKSLREIQCMSVLFPELFVPPLREDYFAGRYIQLPIGHGLEWAHLGGGDSGALSREEQTRTNGLSSPENNCAGSSYYGIIDQILILQQRTDRKGLKKRIERLAAFWETEDTHTRMVGRFQETYPAGLYDKDIHNFLPPILVMTRLSGIEMDYRPLLKRGIIGFREFLRQNGAEESAFLRAGVGALDLLEQSVRHYIRLLEENPSACDHTTLLLHSFRNLLKGPPASFHSAIQLMFLYSQLAGVVNYGRMDEYLGEFLRADLEAGILDKSTAVGYLENLWRLIDHVSNRGNGRVIVGGAGRTHPEGADVFTRLAIQATINTKLVKPQLTLRMDNQTPPDIYELALDAIEKGCTFPMLYNDDLNIPSVETAMRVSPEDARQYTPYGCGEYVIWGKGTGSPNACVNFMKVMQLGFNAGLDPYDRVYRGGEYPFADPGTLKNYEEFEAAYFDYLDYILMVTVHFQQDSYQFMAEQSSFVFASLLMEDCVARQRPLLDGGVRYYGGVNEFYGFSNTIDALAAVKRLVFQEKKYTLEDFIRGMNSNFEGDRALLEEIERVPRFGNDEDFVDEIGIRLHEHACGFIREKAAEVGLHSFLAVNINNNCNTRWGMKTAAGFDGRLRGEHLSPGNNPHSGRDRNGITAMLNSISQFRADIHAGYVQNLKVSPQLFREDREKLKMLFRTYFMRVGGTQLMITAVDQETLLDAKAHPERHPNLLVRCGGFSAKFVELDENTQIEIINRTCNS